MACRQHRKNKKRQKKTVAEHNQYDFSVMTDIGTDCVIEMNQVQFLASFRLCPMEVKSPNLALVSTSYSVSHTVETMCVRRHVRVEVTQLQEAHWVISWRVGVLHVPYSNMFHKYRRRYMRKTVQELSDKFQKPIVILNMAHSIACSSSSREESHVNKRIRMFISSSPEETATRLACLAREETDSGHGLHSFSRQEITTKTFQYYYNLPGINILVALQLTRKFPYIAHFRRSCQTVEAIQAETGVSTPLAERLLSKLK